MELDNKKNEIKPINKEPPRVVLETYAEDMADAVGSDSGILVRKIIHTEEEHEKEKQKFSPESKENKIFMFVSFFLLILAVIALSFLSLRKIITTVTPQVQFTPIIFSDKSTPVDISGLRKDEIAQAVISKINTSTVKAGGLEGIYPTKNNQNIGLREFVNLIKGNFIPPNSTLFVQDSFLMGVVKNQADALPVSGNGFFILLKVHTIADVFDSLRAWEPNIMNDLHSFLGIDISSDTNYLFTKDFQDGIIENKNARILYDKDGNIVLMYIFADDNSVVITGSLNAAYEVMLRLASSRIKQ